MARFIFFLNENHFIPSKERTILRTLFGSSKTCGHRMSFEETNRKTDNKSLLGRGTFVHFGNLDIVKLFSMIGIPLCKLQEMLFLGLCSNIC